MRRDDLHVLDVYHFVNFQPGWDLDANLVIETVANQSSANRRGNGNFTLFEIGFIFTYYAVGYFTFRVDVKQGDICAENYFIRDHGAGLDNFGAGYFVIEFLDAALDETLTIFGGIVFGVFGKVAMPARFGDILYDPGALHADQTFQFVLEMAVTFFGHGEAVGHGSI
jgi:hypothetical protein